MISDNTIQALRSRMDIVEIISDHIKLKKAGANLIGLCPFHDEKTPSFSVSTSKQIYKCFGCGAGGDAIGFIMAYLKKTYPEAIELLCNHYHLQIEYEKKTNEQNGETKNKTIEMYNLLTWAAAKYEEYLRTQSTNSPAMQYLLSRSYTEERLHYWSIGAAPDSWDYLKSQIINNNKYEIGIETGLIHRNGEKSFDFFRNRIIIPIHNHHGQIVGFGARTINNEHPKYLNSPETPVYQKRNIWYGLWQAQKEIIKQKLAYIVEGYFDVHAMQDAGIANTIAPCGTEIHSDQLRLLRRYTPSVCIIGDTDDSGINATLKQIDQYLQHGFSVSVIPIPKQTAKDPDEYIRYLYAEAAQAV